MAYTELGGGVWCALRQRNDATVADERALGGRLTEMSRALVQGDVRFKSVQNMQARIKKIANEVAAGHRKRRINEEVVFDKLCSRLEPGKRAFVPRKGKPNGIMFVGLRGSGKTATCLKYVHRYQKKGWKPALVRAGTFRGGAFDQLKQNPSKASFPFYESCTEVDPIKFAPESVVTFKKENCDSSFVDTNGCREQEASLFEEMQEGAEVIMQEPDWIQAFEQRAPIITKTDDHVSGNSPRHILSTVNTSSAAAPHDLLQKPLHDQVEQGPKQIGASKESTTCDSCPDTGMGCGRDVAPADWILAAAKGKEQDDGEDDDDDDDDEDDDEDEADEEGADDNKVAGGDEGGDEEEELEAGDEEGDEGEGEDEGEAEDNGEDDDGEEEEDEEEEEEEEDVDGNEEGEEEQAEEEEEEDDENGEQDPEDEEEDEASRESEEDVEDLEPPKKKRK